ncbi:MAG TPA: copper-binding protein [Caldimonas sp.]|jgi:Cu(I)/Ag(I) efflux system protein CusF
MKALHLFAVAMLTISAVAHSQQATRSASTPSAIASAAASMTEGEVRKVDKEAGKVTLRHGPIDNLGMPAMTMVFRVADPKMLDQVKEGERVRFSAERLNGAITLTRIEAAK